MAQKSEQTKADKQFEKWLLSAPPMKNEHTVKLEVTLSPRDLIYIAEVARRNGDEIGTYASIMLSGGVCDFKRTSDEFDD